MSHYNVNGGVPKTLMQHLIRWVIASGQFDEAVSSTLQAILDTEITPELIPAAEGERPQSTEATIGPYSLQDFTLFHVLRHGMKPSKIAFLAYHAWSDPTAGAWPEGFPHDERTAYDLATIKQWLAVFCQRFFGFAQFKRSAMPNGPKVRPRRFPVPARGLAGAVRHLRHVVAGGTPDERPRLTYALLGGRRGFGLNRRRGFRLRSGRADGLGRTRGLGLRSRGFGPRPATARTGLPATRRCRTPALVAVAAVGGGL